MPVEVTDVVAYHVRKGRRVHVVWTAVGTNRRERPYLYDLVTKCAVSARTRAGAIKRAHSEARRIGGC